MRELFHRMVFNLVIGNSDDHVKNHGVLHLEGRGWQLAPAFDLVAQLDAHTGYQELAILPGRHVSSLALARMAAPHFGVLEAEAEGVIDRISTVVADGLAKMVAAQGGSAALAARFMEFVKAQADRIRA